MCEAKTQQFILLQRNFLSMWYIHGHFVNELNAKTTYIWPGWHGYFSYKHILCICLSY